MIYITDILPPDTVFESTYTRMLLEIKQRGLVVIDDIITLIKIMQENEMDAHIVIAGQNGVGKTFLLLIIMKKYLGEKWFNNLMLARNTINDVIHFVLSHTNTLLGIDEWNQYLHYRKHSESEQVHFMNQLELARSHGIAFVGCVRDPRKLTLNYRDGKMSIVIWILDRYKKGGSYAAVFVTNPVVETLDRFGFSYLPVDIVDFNDLREQMETQVPSFVGYLRIPDAKELLTKEEIDNYKREKKISNAHAHLNYCVKEFKKKRMEVDEINLQLANLRKLLPKEVIDKVVQELNSFKFTRATRAPVNIRSEIEDIQSKE